MTTHFKVKIADVERAMWSVSYTQTLPDTHSFIWIAIGDPAQAASWAVMDEMTNEVMDTVLA